MSEEVSTKDVENVQSECDAPGEMIWPRPSFDKVAKIPLQKHPRFIRKKRVHSSSFSHSSSNGHTYGDLASDASALVAALNRTHVGLTRCPSDKNSKKSRDGRKVPNKRGGKNLQDPTDILDELELDHEDPDYDSDEQDAVVLETIQPGVTDDDLERAFPVLLREFYIHGKTQEVVDAVVELNLSPHQRRFLPYWAITSALQQKKMQCELTSELLSDLCGPVLTQAHIQQGIQMVLYELGELIIDFPYAVEQIGRFVARALTDDILPPKFIEYQKSVLTRNQRSVSGDNDINRRLSSDSPTASALVGVNISPELSNDSSSLTGSTDTRASSGFVSEASLNTMQPELALSALTRAETLLNLSRAFARLDNIWGIPAGPKATSALVVKVRRLLAQYFESSDVDEARMTLADLDCPHFHHELVYQCIIKYIEISSDKAHQLAVSLLSELCHSAEVTADQMVLGVRRVYAELPDLQLDVPAAYLLMDRFVKSGINGHFIPKRVAMELHTKPRKRIVSETEVAYMSHLASGLF